MYGNSFESFLVGVVVPEKTAVETWAVGENLREDYESLCKNPKTRKYIVDELNKVGRQHKV